jgi:hypothetical protein
MEKWEEVKRGMWEKLPDKEYEINIGDSCYKVGKSTYINYEVAIKQELERKVEDDTKNI